MSLLDHLTGCDSLVKRRGVSKRREMKKVYVKAYWRETIIFLKHLVKESKGRDKRGSRGSYYGAVIEECECEEGEANRKMIRRPQLASRHA